MATALHVPRHDTGLVVFSHDRPVGNKAAVDAQEGRTGAWNLKNEHTLGLKQHDPKARCTLVARLNVSTSQREEKNRSTQGDIYWQRVREK